MKNHIVSMLILSCLIFTGCNSSGNSGIKDKQASADQPNIIFVLADQWRAQAVGYAGNPDVKTPFLISWQKRV